MTTLTKLIAEAIEHKGFAFLNVISPCVTFRGDHQFKEIKEKLRYLPEDHDVTDRTAALRYVREKDVVTTGVLYRVQEPTLGDQLEHIRMVAQGDKPAPTTEDIINHFMPLS